MSTNVANMTLKIGAAATTARVLAQQGPWLGDILNVKTYGAKGDGVTDDTSAIQSCFDAAFGTHGANYYANKGVFFPAGKYITTSALQPGTNTLNAVIFGSGKNSTVINNTTSGSNVILTDGFAYGIISDLSLLSAGGANSACFKWSSASGGLTAQLVCVNVSFDGAARCFRGDGTAQNSELAFINCDFLNASEYGLGTGSGNALNWLVFGGSVGNCSIAGFGGGAFHLAYASGVRFYNNTLDWQMDNGNSTTLVGCYSTSQDFGVFAGFAGVIGAKLVGCIHNNASAGTFVRFIGPVIFDGCQSTNGAIVKGGGGASTAYIRGSNIPNADLATFTGAGGVVAENI